MAWTAEKKREWYQKNKEKCHEYARRYYSKHSKHVKSCNHKYYIENREKILEHNKIYRCGKQKYIDKFSDYMNDFVDKRVIYAEDYNINIELAELDIRCMIRTRIERKVYE